jgi:hypothetical protein
MRRVDLLRLANYEANLRDAFPEVVPHRFRAPAEWEIVRTEGDRANPAIHRRFPGSCTHR